MLKSSSPTVGGSGLPRLEILGIPFVYWDFGTLVLDLELSIEEGVGVSRLILLSALALFASVRFVAAAQDQSRSPSWSQAASNIAAAVDRI